MKYSAALQLTLLSLTAASVIPQQGRDVRHFDSINQTNQHFNPYNRNNYNNGRNNQIADQEFLEKQRVVLQFLSNAEQNKPSQFVADLARNFDPFQNSNKFSNNVAVANFLKNYQNNNFLPQNEAFSPTIQEHINQAAQLFQFFYSAQDWNTFKQAVAWAKPRFNPQLFTYAFTAAVFNHPTTRGIVIPAFYEVIPHSFVPATALQQVYNAKLQGQKYATVYANYTNQNNNNRYFGVKYNNNNNENNNNYYGPHNAHAVYAENDGSQQNNAGVQENPENKVSYFTEDVGVNTFLGYYHTKYPPFFGSNNNNNYYDNIYSSNNNNGDQNNNNNYQKYYNRKTVKRGEDLYFAIQQLYGRYVLERLSNDLPIPQPINFQDKIETGYNPNLQYPNGQAFPARPPNTYFQQQQNSNSNNDNNAKQPNNNQAETPDVYEQRLQEVAESGYVINADGSKTQLNQYNGVGVLANLASFPANSPNPAYYGDYFSVAKNAIGNIIDPNNQNGVAPGAVANYDTAGRDPAFYQFLAKFNQIFRNFQNKQGPYHQNQLSFQGVKIQSFDVSNLVTYFESFFANVDNALNNNFIAENNYYPNNNNNYPNNNNNYPNNNNNYPNNNNNNNYPNNNNNNYPNNNNNNYPNNNNNNNYPNNNNNYPNNNNNYPNNNNNNYNNNYPKTDNVNYPNNNNYNNYPNYNSNNNNNYPNNNNNNNNYPNNNNNYPNNNNNYPNNNNNNNYPNNNNNNNNNNYPNNNNNYPNNNNNNYPNNNNYDPNNNYNPNNNNENQNNFPNNNNNNYPNNQNYNPNYNSNANYNVKFQRLTHKPFNYKLNVQSDRSTNAVVRVFVGPKYDSNGQQFTLPQASQYFVQLDQFAVQLNNGQNVIERNSQQSPLYVNDPTPYYKLWNQVQQAIQGQQPFSRNQDESSQFGFPQRFQLPKGKENGQEFIFYAIITEYNSNNNNNVNSNYNKENGNTERYNDFNNQNTYNNNEYNNNNYNNNYNNFVQDNKSVGFPFDRPVQDVSYNTPNQYFKTVTIYHQSKQNN